MRVHIYHNQLEATRIKAFLEENDIPAEIHSFEEWGYDGAFRSQMGMGEILVPDELEEEAKKIIKEFKCNFS